MKLAILGASGALGKVVTRLAIDAGHEVRAFVRDPAKLGPLAAEVEVIQGDLADPPSLDPAIAGADAVVSCLGPTSNDRSMPELFHEGARSIVATMTRHGVSRLVAISGEGVRLEGDRRSLFNRFAVWAMRLFFDNAVHANERVIEVLETSDLEWVAVRAGYITDGPATGRLRAHATRPQGSRQSRADLGIFMLEQLDSDEWVGKAPFVGV